MLVFNPKAGPISNPGNTPGVSMSCGERRRYSTNTRLSHMRLQLLSDPCRYRCVRVFFVLLLPLTVVRCARAYRAECKRSRPAGTAAAQLSWTAMRRGSWNLHPCNHIQVRGQTRGKEVQLLNVSPLDKSIPCRLNESDIKTQHSHHEEGASAIRCAGALRGVCFGCQTQRAQDQTQEVTHHHQEDHAAQGHTHSPSEDVCTQGV